MIEAVLTCGLAQWRPGIGDPTAMGWVTVLVYLLAALAGLVAARRSVVLSMPRRERAFWLLLAAILLFLALNKQLDLQSLMTAVGRCTAQIQGWYETRARVQRGLILGILLAGGTLVLACLWLLRRSLRRTGLALLGLGLVCIFVLVRAVGFHDVDGLIDRAPAGLRLNWLLELAGPVLVIAGALMVPRRARSRRGRRG